MADLLKCVLVDTSIWIDYLEAKGSLEQRNLFKRFLDQELVRNTDVINHELLVGCSTAKEFSRLSRLLVAIPSFRVRDDELLELNQFGFELKKQGLLAKYTDLTIAFLARREKLRIFSKDRYFEKLAKKGVIEVV